MASGKTRNPLALCLLLLGGIIVGGLLTELAGYVPALSFLTYGKTFGIDMANPMVLDLFVIKLKFALQFRLDVATILGLISAFFIYRKCV